MAVRILPEFRPITWEQLFGEAIANTLKTHFAHSLETDKPIYVQKVVDVTPGQRTHLSTHQSVRILRLLLPKNEERPLLPALRE